MTHIARAHGPSRRSRLFVLSGMLVMAFCILSLCDPGVCAGASARQARKAKKKGSRGHSTSSPSPRRSRGHAGKRNRSVHAPVQPPRFQETPIESPDALASFFHSLEALGQGTGGVVRVLHFGDSHVAADFWTGELRRRLQERFGDGGPGYVMPGRPWRFFRHSLARVERQGEWETAGLGRGPEDGLVGLASVGLETNSSRAMASAAAPGRVARIQMLGRPGAGTAHILVDGILQQVLPLGVDSSGLGTGGEGGTVARFPLTGESQMVLVELPLHADGPHVLSVQGEGDGPVRILGADFLSGRSGIVYDCLGINGAEITRLDRWAPEARRAVLTAASPSLVVVSYGTNDMGGRLFDEATFHEECRRILTELRKDLGNCPVLVTAPVDRRWPSGRRARKAKAASAGYGQKEEAVHRVLREVAHETGCAFWDAREALGGEGSMTSLIAAGMAQKDGVHLTRAGYEKLGELLLGALQRAGESVRRDPAENAS